MPISIPTALEIFASAAKTFTAFTKWRQATINDAWILIEELETNSRYFWAVINKDVPVGDIVSKLSTTEYDRLRRESFDFNSIKPKKIRRYPSLAGTDLGFLGGQETEVLITNIYDRIKDLKDKFPFSNDSTKRRWYTRVVNIQKRIFLLLRHVKA
ncbi:MAG: hypothetical protein HN392_12475 [Anaerolineae bacterium]|jgi:hypothetical protein|nr:hypothetical protein [Anaerolineae bacterium]MBT7073701.1 hypothetical protein [Anaerolineae bacterium]MBT7781409.1 hypothetical protein [Anaerolineae bacterium]